MAHHWDKGDFCGAMRSSHSAPPASTRRLCTFTLDPPPGHRVYPVSGEAIILGDDCVGFTTTANFGDTIGKPIAYGYVPVEHLEPDRLGDRGVRRADPGDETRRRVVRPEGSEVAGMSDFDAVFDARAVVAIGGHTRALGRV